MMGCRKLSGFEVRVLTEGLLDTDCPGPTPIVTVGVFDAVRVLNSTRCRHWVRAMLSVRSLLTRTQSRQKSLQPCIGGKHNSMHS